MIINKMILFLAIIVVLAFGIGFLGWALFFYDSEDGSLENMLQNVGFKDADASGMESGPASPLPDNAVTGFGVSGATDSGFGGGSGASGTSGAVSGQTGSSGEGSSGASTSTMHFCTFEADRIVNNAVPCRCGLSAVCTEVGLICDAMFNEGQGICESGE